MAVSSSVDAAAQQLQAVCLQEEDERRASGAQAGPLLAGCNEALLALRELVLWPLRYAEQGSTLGLSWPAGCLLHGPPGVGKTSLVKAVAAECGAAVFEVTAASIVGAYVGESERRLREAFEAARAAARVAGAPCIVFLDEVDALCPARGSAGGHEARIVAQLLTLLDGASEPGARLVVIAATNRPNAVDPAMRRPGRLDREIAIPPPSREQRRAILELLTASTPLDAAVDLPALAEACTGYTGADLAALCREAAMSVLSSAAAGVALEDLAGLEQTALASQRVTQQHFLAATTRVGPSLVRSMAAQPAAVTWDQIGGLEDVKRRLQQAVEWPVTHADAFRRLGLEPPRGVLLHGPPGCAKTALAQAAATSSGATLLPLSASSLYSMYVGQGEALLQQVFKQARLSAPAIVFLDEVDALFAKRGAGDASSVSMRLLSTLLTEMDGMELATGVLVLAATNRPAMLDAALLRPGRFDVLLYVPPPDEVGRERALEVLSRATPTSADVNLAAIAALTERFTGAELQHLCQEASLSAMREGAGEVTQRHFLASVNRMSAALTPETLAAYSDWGTQFSR